MTNFLPQRNSLFEGRMAPVRFSLLVMLSVGLLACGRMGPPKPPEDFAPAPVVGPVLSGTVDGFVLSWSLPEVDADADETDLPPPLAGFSILKAELKTGEEPKYDDLVELELKTPEEKTFSFTDSEVKPGKTYQYQILPANAEGVLGEATVSLKGTYLGENSRIELIPEKSKRPEKRTTQDDDLDDDTAERR